MSFLDARAVEAPLINPVTVRQRALHTPETRTRVDPIVTVALLDVAAAVTGTLAVLSVADLRNVVGLGLLLAMVVVWPAAMYEARVGHGDLFTHRRLRPARLCRGMVQAVVALGFGVWLLDLAIGRVPMVAAVVATAGVSLLLRALWQGSQEPRRVLLVGRGERADLLSGLMLTSHQNDLTLVGRAAPDVDEILKRAAEGDVKDVVILGSEDLADTDLRRLGWQLEQRHQHLHVATGLLGVGNHRVHVENCGTFGFLGVSPSGSNSLRRGACTLLGRLLAAVLLALVAPLWIAVVIAIRVDSAGPAIFRQQRVGRHGRTFEMLKFRTMSHGAVHPPQEVNDCGGPVLFKARMDPRITQLGAILRRYSIDEIPQLLNVVRGDMSLIGPRPALAHEVARYADDMHRRLAVRPGLTGLWQVSGRSDLNWETTMRLDLDYVDNWSPGLDLRILSRTVPAVLGHRGAY